MRIEMLESVLTFTFDSIGTMTLAAILLLIGHDIGSTPTAVANMTTIHSKYGVSRKALIIVPIVGAFLIDVFYQPFVIWCINMVC